MTINSSNCDLSECCCCCCCPDCPADILCTEQSAFECCESTSCEAESCEDLGIEIRSLPTCLCPQLKPSAKFAAAILLLDLATCVGASAAGKAPSSSDSSIDACSAEPIESYDLRFHIAGIFIVLLTSGFGIFSTLTLSLYRQKLKSYQTIIANILLLFKMFGIGVIAGTAWIHLLPDAFSQFSSPCLEQSWKAYGPAYVGLFGIFAAFLVQPVEFTSEGFKIARSRVRESEMIELRKKSFDCVLSEQTGRGTETEGKERSTLIASPSSDFIIATSDSNLAQPNPRPHLDAYNQHHSKSTVEFFHVIPASHGAATDFDQSLFTSRGLPTIILELGILFHSLIIGITLGVTPDGSFSTLLGAVCFHQMFEGMALGVLIGSLGNLTASTRLILGLLYPLTTPVGIAIGIAVRNSYNSNSSHLIILQGILDSLS